MKSKGEQLAKRMGKWIKVQGWLIRWRRVKKSKEVIKAPTTQPRGSSGR